jgi:hypothetical protein
MALRACLLEESLPGLINRWTPALLRVLHWKTYSPWLAKNVLSFGSNKSIIITRVYCYQSRLDKKKKRWLSHSLGLLFTYTRTHISAFLSNRIPDILCFQSSIFPGATVTCHCRACPKRRVAPRIAVTLQSINPSITAVLLYKPMANSKIYQAARRKASRSFLTLEGTECSAIRSSILLCRVVYSLFACITLLVLL